MWSEGSFVSSTSFLQAHFLLDKNLSSPKPQITALHKEIPLAYYLAKTDIIKTGLKRNPDLRVGVFCFGQQSQRKEDFTESCPQRVVFQDFTSEQKE
jgi:hypothetical protein